MDTLILTFTCCWWDAYTDKILKGDHAGQEAAIFRPDFSNGLSPTPVHHGCQSNGMQHRVEVHALTNHVHRQKETYLRQEMRQNIAYSCKSRAQIYSVIFASEGTELFILTEFILPECLLPNSAPSSQDMNTVAETLVKYR